MNVFKINTGLRNVRLLVMAFILSVPFSMKAQYTVLHEFANDVKEYSSFWIMDPDPFISPSGQDHMAAGTIFGYPNPGYNSPHIIVDDQLGAVLSTQAYDFSSSYQDVRAVSIAGPRPVTTIVTSDTATYYVTCLARPASGNDRIIVMPVSNYGNFVFPHTAYSIRSNNANEGLYPLNSLYIGGDLYICGYVTDNNTNLPSEPGYAGVDHKKGFVIRITNPKGPSFTIANSITIDTRYPSVPPAPFVQYHDFDIAMRLTEMTNGNVHVTGSVNNIKNNGTAWGEYSATMNVVLSRTLNKISDNHFCLGAQDEYGTALYQDVQNNANYIVSNYFVHLTGAFGAPYNTFDVEPTYMNVSYLNSSMNIVTSVPTRYMDRSFNSKWGLTVVPNWTVNANKGSNFWISGMTINEYCGKKGASFSNVLPFVDDVIFTFSGGTGISGTLNSSVSYQTLNGGSGAGTGTGVYPAANSYPILGGGLSNWGWNPVGATDGNGIFITAPRFTNTGLQGLKIIDVDYTTHTDVNCGPSGYIKFFPSDCNGAAYSVRYDRVQGIGQSPYNVTKQYGTLSLSGQTESPVVNVYSRLGGSTCISGSPNYKTTGLSALYTKPNTTIFPNPAVDYIKIGLQSDIAGNANVKVELVNIMGAKVADLYNGLASDLSGLALSLKGVAVGTYVVKIYANGGVLLNQKLVVQQN